MFKKRIGWIGTIGAISVAALPIISCSSNEVQKNESLQLGDKTFSSKVDLLEYVQKRTSEETKKADQTTSKWKLDGVDRTFDSPSDIDKYIEENNMGNELANIVLDNETFQDLENDYFAPLPANTIIPLEANVNGKIINHNEGLAIAFKGYDDQVYFVKADDSETKIEEMEQTAKESWMQFHSAYKFNGIYFRNIEDLEYYLRTEMFQASKNQDEFEKMQNKEVNLPIGEEDGKIIYESFIVPKNPDRKIDTKTLEATLRQEIKAHSQVALSVKGDDGKFEIVKKDETQNNFDLANYINYWNVGATNQNPYYIIDTEKGSRGKIYGSYITQSQNDFGKASPNGMNSGIMLTHGEGANWAETSVTESDIQQSDNDVELTIMNSAISESIINHNKDADGGEDVGMLDALPKDEVSELIGLLNKISSNSSYKYLGSGLEDVNTRLLSGKRYNAFLSLPILREWTISRLLENRTSQENMNAVNQYFINAAENISNWVNEDLGLFLIKNEDESIDPNNALDLNDIYGFRSYKENLHIDPLTAIGNLEDNVINELKVAQGVKSYISTQLIYEPLQNMISGLEKVNNNKNNINNNNNLYNNYNNPRNNNYNNFSMSDIKKISGINFDKTLSGTKFSFENFKFDEITSDFKNELKTKFNEYTTWFLERESTKKENEIIREFNGILDEGYSSNMATRLNDCYISFENEINASNDSLYSEVETSENIGNIEFTKGNSLANKMFEIFKDGFGIVKDIVGTSKIISKSIEKAKNIFHTFEALAVSCAYVEAALIAVELVMFVVDFFTPKVEQKYYSYTHNEHKYFWDGGEHVSKYMGLSQEDTHDIKELKLINPIQINVQHGGIASENSGSASQYYFDGKFYSGTSEIKDKVLSMLKENNWSDLVIPAIFDAENVKLTREYFDGTGNKDIGTDEEFNRIINAISDQIVTEFNYDFNDNSVVLQYLGVIYDTPNGFTEDKAKAQDAYVEEIVSQMKQTYIFQKPETLENGDLKEWEFKLPFPYFSLSSNSVIYASQSSDSDKTTNELLYMSIQYEYNSNLTKSDNAKISVESSISSMIKNYLTKITQTFSISRRIVSYQEAFATIKYLDLKGDIFIRDVYVAKSPLGQVRRYIHKSVAMLWLRNEYNIRLSISGEYEHNYIYHSEIDGKDHIFDTLNEELTWVMKNEVNIQSEKV